jgi:predicted regulator of Ras-like GTPase activity (Roadblock/LC7/MglB family)
MPDTGLIMYEEEFRQIDAELNRLHQQANAVMTFLVDKNGQLIASVGQSQDKVDITSLASLTAGNIAAAGAMAKLVGEKEFTMLFHEGEKENIHITMIGRVILVVIFDQRSSLGLVRLRVKKSAENFVNILQGLLQKVERPAAPQPGGAAPSEAPAPQSPFSEITEDDIEKLFG